MGVAVAIGVLSELSTPPDVTVLGLLAVVPFLAAALSTAVWTASSGAAAVGIAVAAGDYAHALWTRDLRILVAGIAVATGAAGGIALVRARRLRQLQNTRAVADVVQRTLLRPVPAAVDDTAIAAHYTSATRGADVGGDIYEVLATPFGSRVFLGDVRGKGLPAVRLASTALGAFREWCYQLATLPELARQLDVSIARHADMEEFVTSILLQVGPDEIEIVNCGHPPPLLMRDGTVTPIEPDQPSLPLGLGVSIDAKRLRFSAGDRLLLYTDGASEARRGDRFFDVASEFSRLGGHTAEEVVRRMHRRLVRFTRRRLADDVALLLLDRRADLVATGAPAPASQDLADARPPEPGVPAEVTTAE